MLMRLCSVPESRRSNPFNRPRDLRTRPALHGSRLSLARKIDDSLMAWSMRDPALKSQLFRFVDCLPRFDLPLKSPGTSANISEYPVNGFSPPSHHSRQTRRPSHGPKIHRRGVVRSRCRCHRASSPPAISASRSTCWAKRWSPNRKRMNTSRYLYLIDPPHRNFEFPDRSADRLRRHRPDPRQHLGQTLIALQPIRSPRSRGTKAAVLARLRPILRRARRHGDIHQFRHGAIRLQRHHAPNLQIRFHRRRIPRVARRRHRHAGVPAVHTRRSRRPRQMVARAENPITGFAS